MLEESGVVGIKLAMVVRSRVGDGEVHELQSVEDRDVATDDLLQALGCGINSLHLAGRQLYGAKDCLDMSVEFSGVAQFDRVPLKSLFQFDSLGRCDDGIDVALSFNIREHRGILRGDCKSWSAEG